MTRTNPAVLFLSLLVGVGLLLVMASMATPTIPPDIELNLAHTSVHEEASMIRQCSEDPSNLHSIWLNSKGERLNCIIRMPGDQFGDRVIQWCKSRAWFEVTAYMIGGGDLKTTLDVMKAKGCTMVWP